MPLKVQHLNDDATFLLTYTSPSDPSAQFSILTDPWLTGVTITLHRYLSQVEHSVPSAIESLSKLPRPPDAVLISNHLGDHCHEPTLRALADTDTRFYVAFDVASTVRSWKWLSDERVVTLKNTTTIKHGEIEVELTYLPSGDLMTLHCAVGFLFRSAGEETSVLFTPHGCTVAAALPFLDRLDGRLDVLLHPWTTAQSPWWMGGKITVGFEGGWKICRKVGEVGVWGRCHDEKKRLGGFVSFWIRMEDWDGRKGEGAEVGTMVDLGVRGEVEVGKGVEGVRFGEGARRVEWVE